jgi:hypothetical protein
VIYAKNLQQNRTSEYVDVAVWAERVTMAIKKNRGVEIREEVRGFIQAIREAYASRNRSIFYVQSLVISILRLKSDRFYCIIFAGERSVIICLTKLCLKKSAN